MDKEEVSMLLNALFGQVSGCPDPDCSVCKMNRKRMNRVCEELGLDKEATIPRIWREDR